MTRLLWVVTVGYCGVVFTSWSAADDGVPPRPELSPFALQNADQEPPANVTQGRVVTRASDDENKQGGFTWPSLPKPKFPALPKPTLPKLPLPLWSTSKAMEKPRMTEEPSTWQKFNNGTKSLLTKTKQTLMPWTATDEEKSPRKAASVARRPSRSTSAVKNKPAEKKSFFSSWFTHQEEQKPIETVNDYLSLPRVPYE